MDSTSQVQAISRPLFLHVFGIPHPPSIPFHLALLPFFRIFARQTCMHVSIMFVVILSSNIKRPTLQTNMHFGTPAAINGGWVEALGSIAPNESSKSEDIKPQTDSTGFLRFIQHIHIYRYMYFYVGRDGLGFRF